LSMSEANVEIEDLVWHMDEPLADLSSLGFLALSELASKHITVALSGQGADELLGGYAKHKAAAIASAWNRIPGPMRAVGQAAALRGPRRIRRAASTLAASGSVDRLLAMSGRVSDEMRSRLFRGPLAALDGEAARRAVLARLNGFPDDPLPTTLYIDAQLALVDDMLHYFDRASMAHSLEVRVPFLDHRVVEYCAGIPSDLKVRRLTTKYLLKRASRGILPDSIIDKPKIGFFASSVDRWFQTQTQGAIGSYLLRSDTRTGEFLDRDAVTALVRAHADGSDRSNGRLLLSILMLEVWLSSYLPRALAAPSSAAALAPVA
jgi:asparagine synthase (glutamine-hydrolysing)